MITDSIVFLKPFLTNVCFKHTLNVFQDIPETQTIKKSRKKKYLRQSQFLEKRGEGGPARYDHVHRFNIFFSLKPSLRIIVLYQFPTQVPVKLNDRKSQ